MKTLKIAVVGMLAAACVSCASHKGSSSLGKTNNTTQQTPKVKSEEQLKAEREAAELAAEKKRREAEAAAQRAKADAEAKAAEVNAAAQKVLDDAKAKAEEEEARLAAEAKAREEKVTVVETKSEVDGRFYVIIGSFKRLENARAASEAVANQAKKLMNCHDFTTKVKMELVEKLHEITGGRFGGFQFYDSGTTAVEAGLRCARAATGKQEFFSFFRDFHGKTYGSNSLAVVGVDTHMRAPGFMLVPRPNPYRDFFGRSEEEAVREYFDCILSNVKAFNNYENASNFASKVSFKMFHNRRH